MSKSISKIAQFVPRAQATASPLVKATPDPVSEINHPRESASMAEYFQQHAIEVSQHAYKLMKDHPYRTGGMVLAAVPALAPAAVGAGVLGVVGFGSSGPILGSLAATTQGAIGPVVGHGVFATLQSAAMGGYGASAVFGALQGTAVAGLAAGCASYLPWKKHTAKEGDCDGVADSKTLPEIDFDMENGCIMDLDNVAKDAEEDGDGEKSDSKSKVGKPRL